MIDIHIYIYIYIHVYRRCIICRPWLVQSCACKRVSDTWAVGRHRPPVESHVHVAFASCRARSIHGPRELLKGQRKRTGSWTWEMSERACLWPVTEWVEFHTHLPSGHRTSSPRMRDGELATSENSGGSLFLLFFGFSSCTPSCVHTTFSHSNHSEVLRVRNDLHL
jgi:hypothetical protein